MNKKAYPYMLVNKLVKRKNLTKRIAKGIIKYVGTEELDLSVILTKYNHHLSWEKLLQYPILRFLHQKLICDPREKVEDYQQYEQFLLSLTDEDYGGVICDMRFYARYLQCHYLLHLISEYNQNPHLELMQYIELIVKENIMKHNYFNVFEFIASEDWQVSNFKRKVIIPKEIDDMLTPYSVMAKLVLANE